MRILRYTALVLLALLVGAGSAIMSARSPIDGISNGAWTASTETGSKEADAWTRARIAIQALLAMTSDQTFYYSSHKDSDGNALDASCRYTMSGGGFPTRWWSVTIYDEEYFLIENPQKRYSITAKSLDVDASGHWQTSIHKGQGAGLITPPAGPFNLILRLYNPDAQVLANPASVNVPEIRKESCA